MSETMSAKSRTVPNKCFKTRIDIEGRAYRALSFFHEHPSALSEENWSLFQHESGSVIVDKLTLSMMAECQSEFMIHDVDKEAKEPTIVAVRLTTNNQYKALDSN